MQNYVDEFENQSRVAKQLQSYKTRKIVGGWNKLAKLNKGCTPGKQKAKNQDPLECEAHTQTLDQEEYEKMMEELAVEFLRVRFVFIGLIE